MKLFKHEITFSPDYAFIHGYRTETNIHLPQYVLFWILVLGYSLSYVFVNVSIAAASMHVETG